jgi:hypothetical protein
MVRRGVSQASLAGPQVARPIIFVKGEIGMGDLFDKLFNPEKKSVPEKKSETLYDALTDIEAEFGIVIPPGSKEAKEIAKRLQSQEQKQ